MQQTRSYWRYVLALGVVSAFVGAACTVTTSSTDDGTSGAAGQGETGGSTGAGAGTGGGGGSSAGAAASAGAGGNAGANDAVEFQCDADNAGAPPGTPSVCTPDATHMTDTCALCVQANCCSEYSECYATDPGNQCGYGGPNNNGEIACVQACLQQGFADGGVDDSELRTGCASQCVTNTANMGSKTCGDGTTIGNQTNALLDCLTGKCLNECIGG